jgi:hypothetical protein
MQIKILTSKIIQIIYHFLRYFNLVNVDYKINPDLNFGSKIANNFFIKKLKNSKLYLEYGSGSSTLLAARLNKKFISIESDKHFYLYLKKKITECIFKKNLKYKYILEDFGLVSFYSDPLFYKLRKNILKIKAEAYAGSVLNSFLKKKFPDLILIDGRYRVLCALKIYLFLNKYFYNKNNNTVILLDDYKYRKKVYGVLNNFYKISIIGRFGYLKPRKYIIKKFELNITDLLGKFSLDYN